MSHNVIKPEEENTGIIKEQQKIRAADVVRSPVDYSSSVIRPDYASSVAAEHRYASQHNESSDGDRRIEEQRRANETLDSIKFDGDIDLDREKSREQLGYRDYQHSTSEQPAEPYMSRRAHQYQAERYRHTDIEKETPKEARYGTVEKLVTETTVIGGVAGAAAATGAASSIIKENMTGVAGAVVIKDGITETIKTSIIKPQQAAVFAEQINDTSGEALKKQGLLKTVGGIAVRETVAAVGHGGDELSEKVKGQAVKYGYKAGKYAALAANKAIKGKVKNGLSESGVSIKKIIKKEAIEAIEDFHGSDDLGIKALTAPKDVYVTTKRTIKTVKAAGSAAGKVARGTAKAAKATASGVKKVATGAKNLVVKALGSKVGLIVAAIILIVVVIVALIDAIVPNITLKSDNKELTRTYEHITKLDAELTDEIRNIPDGITGWGIDEFHYYVNGYETSAQDITIYTNADYILMYFDTKYDDYAFDKLIYGIFGGTNVKSEVDAIHNTLYSYSTNRWKEEIEHSSSYTDPDTGETVDDSWTEIVWHLDINVTVQSFEQYLSDNITTLLLEDEQERFTILAEVGAYTAHVELGNPFSDDDYYFISSRWGWRIHPITGVLNKHTGIDIPKDGGTPIQNVMSGVVFYVGYSPTGYGNYCIVKSSDGKKEVLYAHMQSVAVFQGQTVNKGDLIGYVGTTGESTGNHLHLEYSIENGFNTNPAFFLAGASYTGIGSDDIVATAASQLGNVGGQPYWSWYGFGSRVEWCACFVSWCANQCGYIDAGIIPRYCGCIAGSNWFKSHGLWQSGGGGYTPIAGDIIFFDWEQDGVTDHTGIVESFDGTTVHTIEGNSGNACRRESYNLYSKVIYGYGTPIYPVKGEE